MTARSGYLASGTEELFVHISEVPSPAGVWLLCSPLLEESVFCRLDLRGLARTLNERQYTTVEFDYGGYGDSTGNHAEVSLDTLNADIDSLVALCRELTGGGQLTLFGLRAGANLSLEAGRRYPDLQCVGWFPIVDGERYLDDLLTLNLASQYAAFGRVRRNKATLLKDALQGVPVNVGGYEVGHALLEDFRRFSINELSGRYDGRDPVVLVEKVSTDDVKKALVFCRVSTVSTRHFWESPKMLEPRHTALTEEMFRRLGVPDAG